MSDEIKVESIQQDSSAEDLRKENAELKAKISSLEDRISDSINKAIEKQLNEKQAKDTFDEAQKNSEILAAERTEKIASLKEQRISRFVKNLEKAVEDMNGLVGHNNYRQNFFATTGNKNVDVMKQLAYYCHKLGPQRFANMVHENIKKNMYKV